MYNATFTDGPYFLQFVLLDEELLHDRRHNQGKEVLDLQLHEEGMKAFLGACPS
jgi:hypothetical protein